MPVAERLLVATIVVVLAAFLGGSALHDASATAELLFDEAARLPPAPPPPSQRLLHRRYVEVNFDALGGRDATAATATTRVILNFFPDALFTAERDRVEPTSSGHGFIWIGHLQGLPGSTVTLVAEDGVLVGNINGCGRTFNVVYVGNDVHLVGEINQGVFPPD